jgi:hypothetical protein
MNSSVLPDPVAVALSTWLTAYDDVAPGVVEGLYVVGSVALDDWTPHSDVDIVAVVADPSDPDLAGDLAAAHAVASQRLHVAVDGPFVAWGDLVVPPVGVARPWVLDGEFHVDGESFELNPVTWYTLATYGITVRGDAASSLGIPLDIADRRHWVRDNLHSYWAGVGQQLAAALETDLVTESTDSAVLEWVALGVVRMLYTWETGDVTSKSGAGRWGARRLPEFAPMLERAVESRGAPGLVSRRDLASAVALVERVVTLAG